MLALNSREKKFLSYYKPYGRRFLVVLVCAVISAAMGVLFPLCVRNITQALLNGTRASLLPALLQLGLLTLVEMLSSGYYDYVGHSIGANMENDLRQELFGHLEEMSIPFYDSHRVGELMSRLTNDLNNLAEMFHHAPEDYLIYSIRFVGSSAVLFILDWRLTLCAYTFLPIMAVLTLTLNRRVRKVSAENLERIGEINARAEEAMSGIRVSQVFNRQEHEKSGFAHAGRRFVSSRKRIYGMEMVEDQTLSVLTRLMYIAVVLVGLLRVRSGGASVADLIAFILYIENLTTPIRHLAWMTTQYQMGLTGFGRAMELLGSAPDIQSPENAEPLAPVKGDIAFDGVSFSYRPDLPVLRDVSFRLPAGRCFAIVGVSGVGKSTICSLIPRFYDIQQGAITLDGRDIRTISLAELREQISIVQQDTYLFSGSVLENIRYGRPDATEAQVRQAARDAGAEEFISRLPEGYATDIGPRGVRLSGGQRQRLSIARAFLRDTPVLILDEATSALDQESERGIQAALEKLRHGRTTICVAHRLSTIRDADVICVLRDGAVSEMGSFDELMSRKGEFYRLYSM